MNQMSSKLPPLIILDRDGVINYDSDNYIKTTEEWIPIPGSMETIDLLSKHGIKVAIATNQSGISRKYFSYSTLHQMHNKLITYLNNYEYAKVDYIAICPHGPNDKCNCRKPKVGMIEEISKKLNIQINREVYFIGDSLKDIQTAENAGCTPILVRTGKGEKTASTIFSLEKNIKIYDNLFQFVTKLVSK